jgi:hypothetical protein
MQFSIARDSIFFIIRFSHVDVIWNWKHDLSKYISVVNNEFVSINKQENWKKNPQRNGRLKGAK